MQAAFDLDVLATCARCGAECEVPVGTATRVLQIDETLYADIERRCVCGSNRVKVTISVGPQSETE